MKAPEKDSIRTRLAKKTAGGIPPPVHSLLKHAERLAATAHFAECLALCDDTLKQHPNNIALLLGFGSLLLNYGLLGAAENCFMQGLRISPQDHRFLLNLARLAYDSGEHGKSRRMHTALLERMPDHPVIRRNTLLSLEYDSEVSDTERLAQAKAWGDWAIQRSGGLMPRPPLRRLDNRRLRIGYVSADLCQHTVGLFVKSVIAAHDSERVAVFSYSAGEVKDWVTAGIRQNSTFRDASAWDDAALAAQIRRDEIDVLVDLSGHTAGSRLTAFALRPAPVQVSWLGYFATTGLPVMDAVLLDDCHAPLGTEEQFVEQVVRLPGGRFCYAPVPFAPEVSPVPCASRNQVTFGSFNNTAKLHAGVYELWSQVLSAVPNSRLVLKWRTFQDAGLCQSVRKTFAGLGIAPERVELRGASFHADALKEYADIDIALDPFPFTGGLTSCESLWMGVPVVTWPQSRVVSRQTLAILFAIGMPQLAAKSRDDYVRMARELAGDRERIEVLRRGLRGRMGASSLCDVTVFTRTLEDTLRELAQRFGDSHNR